MVASSGLTNGPLLVVHPTFVGTPHVNPVAPGWPFVGFGWNFVGDRSSEKGVNVEHVEPKLPVTMPYHRCQCRGSNNSSFAIVFPYSRIK